MQNYSRMTTEQTYHPQETTLKVKLKAWERVVYNSVFHFTLLLILCSIIGIGTPILWGSIWRPKIDRRFEVDLRPECLPLLSTWNVTEDTCPTDCLWDNFTSPNMIRCYYPKETVNDIGKDGYGKLPRYILNKTVYFAGDSDEPVRYHIIQLLNAPPFLDKNNTNIKKGPIIVQQLRVEICHYTENHLSIQIRPENENFNLWNRYLDFNYPKNMNCSAENAKLSNAEISIKTNSKDSGLNEKIFQLQVSRKSTGKSIFNMGTQTPFIYSNGYIEISTMLINDFVWGLGQSYSERFRHNFSQPKKWNLISQFNERELNDNSTAMWGSHPFYLGVDNPEDGDAYGVLLVNTHPITISINARPSISFATSNGHLEFHFFLGPRPGDVLNQLQDFIHRPAMPPYWALGHHICTETCSIPSPTLSHILTQANIPVESDCGTSLRKVGDKNIFENFKNDRLREFSTKSIGTQRRFISAEIPQRPELNQNTNLFKKSLRYSDKNLPFVGYVPRCDSQNVLNDEASTYPDLFNAEARKEYEISEEFLPFADAYILSWNTPWNSKNINGSITCELIVEDYRWNSENLANLTRQSVCLNSRLSDSDFSKDLHENNDFNYMGDYLALHNLYGYQHTKMISEIKQRLSDTKRAFILSLSTFIGIGHWGGHLGTHINSTWEAMRMTLKQTLDFSLFGIPMTGFPVGGFRGSYPSDELLRRWYQLASVMPILFAHNEFHTESRALREGSVRETIRATVQTRYRLLPYLYTQFWNATMNGALVVKPLFFEFYNDIHCYSINNQFMLGPSLMITPALNESDTSLDVYFPKGQRWYEYFSGHLEAKAHGGIREVSAVEQNAPLHIRGGHVIVTHSRIFTSIDEIRKSSGFQVIAALDSQTAAGSFYLDDGITQMDEHNEIPNLKVYFQFHYNSIEINMTNTKQFCETFTGNQQDIQPIINTTLTNIRMYGVIDKPYHNYTDNAVANLYKNGVHTGRISAVTYQNNFGVLSFDVELNFCDAKTYYINWTYPSWQQDVIHK